MAKPGYLVATALITGFGLISFAQGQQILDANGYVDWKRECRRLPPVAIGMTEYEVAWSRWGGGHDSEKNTLETATGIGVQLVRREGPACNADGTVPTYPKYSTIYFEHGVVIAIQQ